MILFTFAALAAAEQAPPPPVLRRPPPIMTVPVPPPPPPVYYPVAPPPPPAPPPYPPSSYPVTPAKPKGSPGLWITTDDYPAASLRNLEAGTVAFRLLIDRSGRTSDCSILESSGHAGLDQHTCKLLTRRARFTPASDINGDAVEGSYASRVRWTIPPPEAPEPGRTITEYVLDEQGMKQQCAFTDVRGDRVTEECDNHEPMQPYLDKEGRPVRRKVTIREDVSVSEIP